MAGAAGRGCPEGGLTWQPSEFFSRLEEGRRKEMRKRKEKEEEEKRDLAFKRKKKRWVPRVLAMSSYLFGKEEMRDFSHPGLVMSHSIFTSLSLLKDTQVSHTLIKSI